MSAPPRVRAHLIGAPDGAVPVLHRGRDAVYVEVAGRCVGIVGRRATAVPCALRSRSDDLRPSSGSLPGKEAYLREGVLHLDGLPLRIGRIVDVRVPPLPDPTNPVAAQAIPPAAVTEFVGPLSGGLTPESVVGVVGRGDGLTPLGDDIVCGWLAVHRAAGIASPDVDAAVRGRAATLAAVGHTSGSGMLYGAGLALSALHPSGAAA